MAPLTSKARKALPKSEFIFPDKRAYPDDTKNRARNALSRVSQHGSPAQQAKVRSAVHRKYPSIHVSGRKSGR